MSPDRRNSNIWLNLLIGVQLLTLTVFGIMTVSRFPVWSPIDEGAHYAYVQEIAQHGRLPVLGKTYTSQAVLAITHHANPAHFYIDPTTQGLGGLSYEAFQPPLYYAIAAPVFDAVPGYMNKVYALRAFDLLLLLLAAVLALRLCRAVVPRHWRVVAPLVLSMFLLPGVVVRSVTISDEALELPIALLFTVTFLWAWSRPSARRVAAVGAVLAACVLTQVLLLCLAPLFLAALWRWWRHNRYSFADAGFLGSAAVLIGLPLVLVGPWLAFNEVHYHALTASQLAVKLQTPIVNPKHVHFSVRNLPMDTVNRLWELLLPEEWNAAMAAHPQSIVNWLRGAVTVMLVPVLAVAMAAGGRKFLRNRVAWLAVPFLAVTAILWWITYVSQWDVMIGRYTYAVLPEWALAGAVGMGASGGRRFVVALASTLTVVLIFTWVRLAGLFL